MSEKSLNIEKMDYESIIIFGNLDDFLRKIELNNDDLKKVITYKNDNGSTLLHKALSAGKFDIANYLLQNDIDINIISKGGNNEFHMLAARINDPGALEIAEILLKKNVSLNQKDFKYGNTAFFTLCFEAFKKRNDEVLKFLEKCMYSFSNIDEKNKADFSVRDLLNQRGSENLRILMEKIYG